MMSTPERQQTPPPGRRRESRHIFRRLRFAASANHRWVTPVLALLVLLIIVAGAIIISSITRQQVHLDDGTVWVTSLRDRKAARFNVRLQEADAGISSAATRFDVAQHDSTTILSEGTKATSIMASTLGTGTKTETPSDSVTYTGGGTVAFLNTKSGSVWAGSPSHLDSISPANDKPQMNLGAGGKVAVSQDGIVYGYRPADGMVLVLDDPSSSNVRELVSLSDGRQRSVDDFTVIGDKPVIAAEGTIVWQSGSATTGGTGALTLQAPPADDGQSDWVAASSPSGLFLTSLGDGQHEALALPNGGSAPAAKAVSSQGCVYAAWSQAAHNYVRACSPKDSTAAFKTLQGVESTSDLVFRTNHRQVVLNDISNGNVWNPQDSTDVIKIQWQTLQTEQTTKQNQNDDSANNQREFNKTCSSQSGQIKANDDEFGARAGARQILDVLRNDEQTDCSVLQITKVGASSGNDVNVSAIYDGRYLQLDASNAQAGKATVSYEISDGRGQTSSASVTINITADAKNTAPKQTDIPPQYDVEQGATFTTNALASFSDPDGDPLTLAAAVAQNSNQVVVSTRADGQLVFNTGSMVSGRVGVQVTVSDGQETGTGILYFSVHAANTLPAAIDPVVKQTIPNTETTIDLKPYVHGTSLQPALLSSASSPNGASTSINSANLTITFTAQNPGTYYVPYVITQGTIEATGLARVEVKPVAGEAAKPIAANDVALLGADNTAIVEPLTNDVDPMGGVLAVTAVDADPALGIKTGLVGHRRVYLTARQVPTTPVKLSYTVTNEAGASQGTIVLQPPALTTGASVPKAANITTQVRAGGIVSVNALDHVSYSDGTTVTLQSALQYDKATFKGLAFVSGDNVRYQAGDQTGVFPVTYTVKDNLGNSASGVITITVHPKNADGKAAPTPKDMTAQVPAGQKVRIPITLTGIDVDGDDDMLLGLGNTAPKLGRISEVGADYLVYEAYADSTGTDTFSYAVEDWTGQRAQAQIRVGVFADASGSGVYARDDSISLRPNTAATVPVTQNDISGEDTDLSVDKQLEAQGVKDAHVVDNAIAFTTTGDTATAYIVYTVKDKAGLSDTATLTITVSPEAPISPPTAYDYRVPAVATIDKKTVDVDVSQWIANPSGSSDELRVGVDSSASDHARVNGDATSRVVTVDLTDEARAVPYTVTNTTYHITSTAFIEVPAYGVFPPVLRPKAPALKVNARESITIAIADYVRVGAGKSPYVESKDTVSATKAADGDLYVNDQTLKFTAPKDYAGPASITFSACDGKRGDDANSIVSCAMLTLPITVIGRTVPPPTFSSSTIDVVAGESPTTIDLTALTHSPTTDYSDEKAYTYSGGSSSGQITVTVSAQGKLNASAAKDATAGTTVSVPITITYENGTVKAGISVRVVQSNRPLARVPAATTKINAGSTEHVQLLSGAFNPFPDTPLTAVSCVADDSAKLNIGCGSTGDIAITAASDIGASSNTVLVTVQDGTKSKERQVTATITVSVIDKPNPPLLSPIAGQPADSSVNLTWTAGNANGSPITEYQVEWDGGSKSCGTVTTCQITGLTNGKNYSFTVKAKNEAGWSKPSAAVEGMPDKVPDPPKGVKVEGGYKTAKVSWSGPDYVGTKPDSYTVTLTSSTGWTATKTTSSLSQDFTIDNGSINDGTQFSATVKGHNRAGDGQVGNPSAPSVVWGDPDAPGIEMNQSDKDNVRIAVSLGNMRNAGCSRIEISGDLTRTLNNCGSPSTSFKLDDGQYHTLTVRAKAIPAKSGAAESPAATADITPTYDVSAPTGVSVSGAGNACTVRWSKNGRASGFIVTLNGAEQRPGADATSATFTLAPWQSCGTASVQQVFSGGQSDAATERSPYTYKVAPEITVPQLTWSDDSADIITVSGGNVQVFNQPVDIKLVIRSGGSYESCSWPVDRNLCNVSNLPATGSYSAQITVTSTTGESVMNASSDSFAVQGVRKTAPAAGDPGTGKSAAFHIPSPLQELALHYRRFT